MPELDPNDPDLKRYLRAREYLDPPDPEKVEHFLRIYNSKLDPPVERKIVRVTNPWWEEADLTIMEQLVSVARFAVHGEAAHNPEKDKRIAAQIRDILRDQHKKHIATAIERHPELEHDPRRLRDYVAALNSVAERDARQLSEKSTFDKATGTVKGGFDKIAGAQLMWAFGNWAIQRAGWYYGGWDIAWLVTTYIGAKEAGQIDTVPWSPALFEAFCHGCWTFFWTDDITYWTAHPEIHKELVGENGDSARYHNLSGPAVRSDIEDLYYVHGVAVPAHAVVAPELITVQEILEEKNTETQRVLIEQMTWPVFIDKSGAKCVDTRKNERDQQVEQLFEMPVGPRRLMVYDPSTGRRYALGVPVETKTCAEAQAWLSQGIDAVVLNRS